MTSAGDQFIGVTKKGTPEYGLVYRSVTHKGLKDSCVELQKKTPPQKFAAYIPAGGLGTDFVLFAAAVVDLQEKRHTADYEPLVKIRLADASLAIRTAESAVARFGALQANTRTTFLALLTFKSRSD